MARTRYVAIEHMKEKKNVFDYIFGPTFQRAKPPFLIERVTAAIGRHSHKHLIADFYGTQEELEFIVKALNDREDDRGT